MKHDNRIMPRPSQTPVPLAVTQPSAQFCSRWGSTAGWSNVDSIRQRLLRLTTEVEEARKAASKAEMRVFNNEFQTLLDIQKVIGLDIRLQSLRALL
jgi:hypothetical protein